MLIDYLIYQLNNYVKKKKHLYFQIYLKLSTNTEANNSSSSTKNWPFASVISIYSNLQKKIVIFKYN